MADSCLLLTGSLLLSLRDLRRSLGLLLGDLFRLCAALAAGLITTQLSSLLQSLLALLLSLGLVDVLWGGNTRTAHTR